MIMIQYKSWTSSHFFLWKSFKYHEDTNQTTSVNFNGERKQLTVIKGDYLLIIYGVNNTVSPKLYYAYAILNNLSK